LTSRDPLIRHAITPPAFDGRNGIHRERLVDAIHGNMPRKLIAIAAPAGYGKTTLLADFGAHTDLTVCWVRLTEADWDVMRFAHVLAASLQNRFRRLKGQPDLDALATSSPEALAVAFASAIEEQIAETFVVALDDVHLVNRSQPVLQFLDRLLEDLPEQATVIAAGREVLEVSLARLMAERDLAGFGPHDLALTREELIELTELQQSEPLSEPELDHLLEESRGWVTGVVMSGRVADISAGSLIGGGRPMVYEYLASVVLNRQPDDLRRFALDASVLPIMTAESCNSVLGRSDSRKYLARLDRRGLFVTASTTTPKTYEFHPLFREFLTQSLEGADEKRLKLLRRKAAEFLLDQDSPELAIDLLIDAGSISRAAKLAERSSKMLFEGGRIQTIERWANRLQDEEIVVPNLVLHLATSQYDKGNLQEAESLLLELKGVINSSSPKDIRARYQITKGFIALRNGRYSEAKRAAARIDKIHAGRANRRNQGIGLRIRALAEAQQSENFHSAERFGLEAAEGLAAANDEFNLMLALIDLSNIQTALGKSPEADRTRARVLDIARKLGAPLPLAVALNNRAWGAHMLGEYELALNLSREGLKYSRQAANPLREGINMIRQADVFNDLGLALQAAELYGEALGIFMALDNVPWIRYSCTQTSVLHRRRSGAGLAHEWIKRALVLDGDQGAPAMVQIQMAALESGSAPNQALGLLENLDAQYKGKLESRDQTLMAYFRAAAAYELGDKARSLEFLSEAIRLAGSHGSEQLLAAELRFSERMLDLAREAFEADPTLSVIHNRIEKMLAFAGRYDIGEEAEPEPVEVEVRALGPVKVLIDGQERSGLKPLAKEVLLSLVDHGRISRDRLLESFWPDQPIGRQTSNLHTAIYSIRRALGREMVVFDGSIYSLDPEAPIEYDVARYEQAAAVADALPPGDPRLMFALTEAVNSYGGEFAPEFDSRWAEDRRRELQLRFLDLLASKSEEAMVRDRPGEAVASLKEALRIDPLRDDTNKQILEALGRLGRRSELVTHYHQYVQLLSEELGLDPPEEIMELYERLIS
jgi:ATP/maltotriose-dependent transcriptional regulator MalT/DNA-binding SARP family transcriptional activator